MTTNISYGPTLDAWVGFVPLLTDLINKHHFQKICDVGGGANPVLSEDFIKDKSLDYSVLDISESELSKAPKYYHKIQADIASRDFVIDQKFDLIFSKMLAEHISDSDQFHRNILNNLTDNGIAVHFFPTLFAFPFFINSVIPENLADALLRVLAPRNRYQHEKFPAYYRSCRGPSRQQIKHFIALGYDVLEYQGFFGHGGYYEKIRPLQKIHDIKTNYLLKNPNPAFTSYACVVLQKAST
jgi:2-polyprenyl-3-methyl-5-hydroxy-6-metoxy-1,4-benzoquinol methylase